MSAPEGAAMPGDKPEIVVMDLDSVLLREAAVQVELERLDEQISRLMVERERLSGLADDLHWLAQKRRR